jgi:hypothetical protein
MAKRPKRPRDVIQLAKLIGDIAVGEVEEAPIPAPTPASETRRKGGLKGGKARARKLSPKKRRAIVKRAAGVRWHTS